MNFIVLIRMALVHMERAMITISVVLCVTFMEVLECLKLQHQGWFLRILLELCISLTFRYLTDIIWHLNASFFRKLRILFPTYIFAEKALKLCQIWPQDNLGVIVVPAREPRIICSNYSLNLWAVDYLVHLRKQRTL